MENDKDYVVIINGQYHVDVNADSTVNAIKAALDFVEKNHRQVYIKSAYVL